MPRITDTFTKTAIYIYGSVEDAERGREIGGSGFVVDIPLGHDSARRSFFAVTNKHVVLPRQSPVIRLNRRNGGVGGLITKPADWTFDGLGPDVAVLPLNLNLADYDFTSVAVEMFVTPKIMADDDIGIGDDTVMVGRFIGHDGKQRNIPSARFGNVAMMPENIKDVAGSEHYAFLVELRSMPGYSGSPVYIYSPNAMQDMSRHRGAAIWAHSQHLICSVQTLRSAWN